MRMQAVVVAEEAGGDRFLRARLGKTAWQNRFLRARLGKTVRKGTCFFTGKRARAQRCGIS